MLSLKTSIQPGLIRHTAAVPTVKLKVMVTAEEQPRIMWLMNAPVYGVIAAAVVQKGDSFHGCWTSGETWITFKYVSLKWAKKSVLKNLPGLPKWAGKKKIKDRLSKIGWELEPMWGHSYPVSKEFLTKRIPGLKL